MTLSDLVARASDLVQLANETARKQYRSSSGPTYIDPDALARLMTAGLSFINMCFGSSHPYYLTWNAHMERVKTHAQEREIVFFRGVLDAVHNELAGGWLQTTKGLVSAEIFADFLEMAEHLLDEQYKDAAAVMVGSVLEEHLRQLCTRAQIATTIPRAGGTAAKKADTLNAELAGAGAYNKLDQKQITAWLDLRNKAAHGHYNEYNGGQVRGMLDGVTNFMARHPI